MLFKLTKCHFCSVLFMYMFVYVVGKSNQFMELKQDMEGESELDSEDKLPLENVFKENRNSTKSEENSEDSGVNPSEEEKDEEKQSETEEKQSKTEEKNEEKQSETEEKNEEKQSETEEKNEEKQSKTEEEDEDDDSENEEEQEEKSDLNNSTTEKKMNKTSAAPTEKVKEEPPEKLFAISNADEKICLLAKFEAVFSIIYSGKRGDEKAEVSVPINANSKGKCETDSNLPLLQVSWQRYAFTIIFNKTEEDNWVASSMELSYDTSERLFDGAVYAGKKTARSKPLSLFETPLGKSYYCPAQETVLMYKGNKQMVTARIKDIHLQPYSVEDGKFSPSHRCDKVVFGGPDETVFVQDETVPLAVGCTLAIITLIILIGFSIHRAVNAAKAEYNSMAP